MIVELFDSGIVIYNKGGEVQIKLETGAVITKDETLLNLPVSLGDHVFIFNNFLIAGEKSSAQGAIL